MPRGKAHPADVRAAAEGLLLAGKSQSEVCNLTALPKRTVARIAAGLGDQLAQVGIEKKAAVGDLIMGYFRAALRAMTSQAEVAGDPEYIRQHDPDKVAILHGVIGDKLAGIATTAQALGLIGPQAADPALPAPADVESD
jgi:hypothetical protein